MNQASALAPRQAKSVEPLSGVHERIQKCINGFGSLADQLDAGVSRLRGRIYGEGEESGMRAATADGGTLTGDVARLEMLMTRIGNQIEQLSQMIG